MNGQNRILLGLLLIARNPATLLFLAPMVLLVVPVLVLLGVGWSLLKLAEIVLAKQPTMMQPQTNVPQPKVHKC